MWKKNKFEIHVLNMNKVNYEKKNENENERAKINTLFHLIEPTI